MVHRDESCVSFFFQTINEFIQVRFPLLGEFKVKSSLVSVGEKGEISWVEKILLLGVSSTPIAKC